MREVHAQIVSSNNFFIVEERHTTHLYNLEQLTRGIIKVVYIVSAPVSVWPLELDISVLVNIDVPFRVYCKYIYILIYSSKHLFIKIYNLLVRNLSNYRYISILILIIIINLYLYFEIINNRNMKLKEISFKIINKSKK